jgi:CheY-like chemotaxis protein
VESHLGRGTRFVIYFPVVGAAVAEPGQKPEAVTPDEHRATILLVEDDAAVRVMTSRILGSNGYQVIEAAGGVEALSILERLDAEPDLLLSDIVMPGMSGYELAERVAVLRPNLRLLFVSGYPGAATENPTPIQAHTPTLRKPFTSAALLAAVREVISGATRSGA